MTASETFESLRPRLFGIAYRMLGSASDAEDVVQETFLRYRRALDAGTPIGSLRAYLSATATRLAIDELRAARHRREDYVGVWLPEPLLTAGLEAQPDAAFERAESLSMAFLLLLERLGAVERAAFLLHDVFDYDYGEVAAIVDKTEANCRQLVARARRRIRAERPRFEATAAEREALAARFFNAMTGGDLDGLVRLLAADVVASGDGGGKAPQWSRPIAGPVPVAKLLVGVGRQIDLLGLSLQRREVNGQPGAIVLDAGGRLVNVLSLEIDGGAILSIRSVINPEKLRHLGPVADAWALN